VRLLFAFCGHFEIGLLTGFFGGVIGFFVTKLLVERFFVAETPAGGVLLVLLPSSLGVCCLFLGVVLSFWRLWKTRARKSIQPK
jgi:hypothetical protein